MDDALRLTAEQWQAIAAQPSGIARIENPETQKVYLLIEENRASELYNDWLRDQLQVGFDEADRGDVAPWNADQFLAKMHQQHAAAD